MFGVAISASLAVLVVMLASISLLPALLSYLGPKVDRWRLPLIGRGRKDPTGESSAAARWAHAVQRRPWVAAIAATAVLLALAAPALGMRLGFPDAGNDPPDTMTRQAYDLNTQGFGPGTNGPIVIAAELPNPAAKAKLAQFANSLRRESGVALADVQLGRPGRDRHRDPDDLAAGQEDRGPGQSPARPGDPDSAPRHEHRRAGRWRDGGAGGSE
jgi:RND superfamily putative drug exporter